MTTYTYTGTFLNWADTTDDLLGIASTTLKIVSADADDSFSYSKLPPEPGDDDDFPSAELLGASPYNVWLDGVQVPFGGDVLIGQIGWGSGNVSYLMIIVNANDDDHVFQLGGDLIPEFATLAEFNAFDATITSATGITSGAFAPGNLIDFDSMPGVVVSEHDTIQGDNSRNVFHGGAGRDRIHGEGGRDKLYGDAGNDRLWGDDRADKLYGGTGRDSLWGDNGNDVLYGNGGDDFLNGGAHDDRLFGGNDSDVLFGKNGKDLLVGGKGFDNLSGGRGADILQGGGGTDDMRGGAGADVFLYSGAQNEGGDVIFDFKRGVDKIHIGGDVVFDNIKITGDEFATDLSWNDTTVTMFGVDFSTVTSDDFVFI